MTNTTATLHPPQEGKTNLTLKRALVIDKLMRPMMDIPPENARIGFKMFDVLNGNQLLQSFTKLRNGSLLVKVKIRTQVKELL